MIDREQFYYLFVHANSLAELGLRFAAAEAGRALEEEPQARDEPDGPDATPDFSGLDLGALDGLDFYGGESDLEPVTPLPDSDDDAAAGSGPLAVDDYLERAYAHQEHLRGRIDAAFGKADLGRLQQLLARTSDDVPALTRRLSGAELDRWLDLYKAGDEAVSEIVLMVRQLEH